MRVFRLVSLNLNGIRSAAAKGFEAWAEGVGADCMGVQEIEAAPLVIDDDFTPVSAARRANCRADGETGEPCNRNATTDRHDPRRDRTRDRAGAERRHHRAARPGRRRQRLRAGRAASSTCAAVGPVRFVFPHAPTRPVTINGGYVMRAWYDILGADLVRREDEAGLRASQALVEALIAREKARGIPADAHRARRLLAGLRDGAA